MTAPKTPSAPPFAAIGACCASGATVYDPWTGARRCEFCGLPVPLPNVAGAALHGAESPETPAIVARSGSDQTLTVSATPVDEPPLVMGGQGRDASETISDAWGIVGTLLLLGFVAAAFAVGVWAAGGGR